MEDKTNIYKKLAKARKFVADLQTKAEGSLGNRGVYYTPEQVYSVATQAEEHAGLICMPMKLEQTEVGLVGTIYVVDIDTKQQIEISMITDSAAIPKASPVMNMGGTYTYTERYLLSSLFRIRSVSTVDVDKQSPVEPFAKKESSNMPFKTKGQISKEEFERRFKK